MDRLFTYLNNPIFKHLMFWILVYSFYIAVDKVHYNDAQDLYLTKFVYLIFQMIAAYTIIVIIIPTYLINKNLFLVGLYVFLLFVVLNMLYVGWSLWTYTEADDNCVYRFRQRYSELPILQQIVAWRKDGLIVFTMFLQPTLFLVPFLWYEKNLKLSVANEQKKIAELEALKNQLNPHFLFNTLNNLYSLAIAKSDKTPVVIEYLSDILDYILYRCKDKYVPLEKEVELIDNYLALEQIRYSNRVRVTFYKEIQTHANIAPLLLLTFVENAFKHGVREEIRQAKIDIFLIAKSESIRFEIINTKPTAQVENKKKGLGLENVRNQLELLYPKAYNLDVMDTNKQYSITLTIDNTHV